MTQGIFRNRKAMSSKKNQAYNFSLHGVGAFVTCNGLEEFQKVLERDFFAEVAAECGFNPRKQKTDIVLNIHCNFGLTESLHHFNTGNWGGFSPEDDTVGGSQFDEAFQNLCEANNNAVDIAELSIHFKDTSLIVSRVQDYSIPEELGSIIFKISEHFVYFTKGLTEMPYEIFVPVFEDTDQGMIEVEGNRVQYYDFWGLYFEDNLNHNVLVYDLKTKELQQEDFFLLD